MKTKVEVDLVTMFKFTASNKSDAVADYPVSYPEDDWSITEYAETQEELLSLVIPRIVNSGIRVARWFLESVDVIIYQDQKFEVSPTKSVEVQGDYVYGKESFLNRIYSNDLCKSLIEEKKKEEEKNKRLTEERRKNEEIKKEKEMLVKLLKKYPILGGSGEDRINKPLEMGAGKHPSKSN